jgi:L-aspartate semialdehyde sulfurtransferase ferredoxin
MSGLSQYQLSRKSQFRVSVSSRDSHTVRSRIRIHLPQRYQKQLILAQLSAEQGLSVRMTGERLATRYSSEQLDLELAGTIAQIHQGFAYLESLGIKVYGKPNVDGDSWHY